MRKVKFPTGIKPMIFMTRSSRDEHYVFLIRNLRFAWTTVSECKKTNMTVNLWNIYGCQSLYNPPKTTSHLDTQTFVVLYIILNPEEQLLSRLDLKVDVVLPIELISRNKRTFLLHQFFHSNVVIFCTLADYSLAWGLQEVHRNLVIDF